MGPVRNWPKPQVVFFAFWPSFNYSWSFLFGKDYSLRFNLFLFSLLLLPRLESWEAWGKWKLYFGVFDVEARREWLGGTKPEFNIVVISIRETLMKIFSCIKSDAYPIGDEALQVSTSIATLTWNINDVFNFLEALLKYGLNVTG